MMPENPCPATADIAPDGLLICYLDADHPGMHRDYVWWMVPPVQPLELDIPEETTR